MIPLHEQYRPQTWDDVVGQGKALAKIQTLARRGLGDPHVVGAWSRLRQIKGGVQDFRPYPAIGIGRQDRTTDHFGKDGPVESLAAYLDGVGSCCSTHSKVTVQHKKRIARQDRTGQVAKHQNEFQLSG